MKIYDEIISFKTSKLAKKKGFDITSWFGNDASLYDKTGEHVYYSNYGLMGSGLSDDYIKAPTQTLLQKWLREEHNLFVEVRNCGAVLEYKATEWVIEFSFKIFGLSKTGGLFHRTFSKEFYKTTEDALEKGLIEVLKLIKIDLD